MATEGEGIELYHGLYSDPIGFLPIETELPAALVYDSAQDATGAIWAATAAGVGRFADGEWSAPIAPGALPAPGVHKLAPDAQGIWLATEAGLARYTFESDVVQSDPLFAGRAVNTLVL